MEAAIDPTTNPEGVQLDELGNPIPPPQSNISEEVMQDMKNIWGVFDMEEKNKVDIKEVKTIMKALDIKVDDPDVLDLICEQIDPEKTGFITFESLTEVMEEQLKEKDTMEDLLEQLKKLDKDNDGKIPCPEFKQYMANLGMKMNPEDIEELIKFADPRGEGAIEIAEFAEALCPPKK